MKEEFGVKYHSAMKRDKLLDAGRCCGHGCRECPYKPKHQRGSTEVARTYELVTVDDFVQVENITDENLSKMLEEFKVLVFKLRELKRNTMDSFTLKKYTWVDDGKEDITIRVQL